MILIQAVQDIRDYRAFKRNLKTEFKLFNRLYTTLNCFVCNALLVTYGVNGALEKRELVLEPNCAT